MDIDKVIQNLREAKKKASCPPGFKYSKKRKSCVPIKKKGKKYGYGVRGYYMGGGYYRGGDNRSDSGKGNRNGNGNGCLLYTSPSPRDQLTSRMPSSA